MLEYLPAFTPKMDQNGPNVSKYSNTIEHLGLFIALLSDGPNRKGSCAAMAMTYDDQTSNLGLHNLLNQAQKGAQQRVIPQDVHPEYQNTCFDY